MKDKHYSLISRLLMLLVGILFIVAVWEWIAQWFGYTLTWMPYGPGRLLELAAIMAIFVMTLLLRQIRDALRNK
jgi:hypothetical protein